MNRLKKEELRKYNAKQQGKTTEEIAEMDAQEKREELINGIVRSIHAKLFPEEYDFMADSIDDADDRKKGINPMSDVYIEKVAERRRVLGFSPLSEAGERMSFDTYRFCSELIKSGFDAAEYQKRFDAAKLKLALSMK